MQTRSPLLVVGLFIACAAPACSKTDEAPPPDAALDMGGGGTDTTTDTATGACPAASGFVVAAPTCSNIANGAPAVPFTQGTGAAPTFTGGTLRDGLYHATRAEGFGTTTGSGRKLTLLVLDGGTQFLYGGEVLDAAGGQSVGLVRMNATGAASGSSIAFSVTCMAPGTASLPTTLDYTVSGNDLIMGTTNGSVTSITTYTRQGCP